MATHSNWVKVDHVLMVKRYRELYLSLRETADRRGNLPRLHLPSLFLDFLSAAGVVDYASIVEVMGAEDSRRALDITEQVVALLDKIGEAD